MCGAHKAAKHAERGDHVKVTLMEEAAFRTDRLSDVPVAARLCQTRASWRNPPATRLPRPHDAVPTGPH